MTIPHPDYPDIDFKPAIARYDWDQTYDVLEFVHLPQGFDGLMQSVGIPAFELMAIDRYTPYSYLWAEEYSDAVYNFLKQFNFSPHNSIVERLLRDESNALIKDSNNNNITVPKFEFTGDKYSKTAEYSITLTEGKYKLTCLINQGWKDGVIGSITTLNQAHYAFTLDETTDVDLNQIINHFCKDDSDDGKQWEYNGSEWVEVEVNKFCINSLVLSKLNGSQWQSVAVDAPSFLFYSDIADYWEEVSNALLQYFSNVYTNYDLNASFEVPIQNYIESVTLNLSFYVRGTVIYGAVTDTFINISPEKTVKKFPVYFLEHCYLQYANNNRWGTSGILDDKGISINNNFLLIPSISLIDFKFNEDNLFPLVEAEANQVLNFIESDLNPYPPLHRDGFIRGIVGWHLRPNFIPASTFYIDRFVSGLGLFRRYAEGGGYFQGWNNTEFDSFFAYQARCFFYSYLSEISYDSNYIDIEEFSLGSNPTSIAVTEALYTYTISIDFEDSKSVVTYPYPVQAYSRITDFTSFFRFDNSFPIIRRNKVLTQAKWLELYSYNAVSDEDYLNYLLYTKAQTEENMVDSVRVKEIHACLGANEFAYYDNNGTLTPYQMHIARNLDYLMKTFGLYYNPDGTLMSITTDVSIPPPNP